MKPSRVRRFESPQLPEQLPAELVTTLVDDAEFSRIAVEQSDFSGQTATNIVFDQVLLQRDSFSRSRLRGMRLTDVRIKSSDCSSAVWEKARWRRIHIEGCRLIGFQLREIHGVDVLMQECNLEGAIITAAFLKSARFVQCNLRRALLEGTDLGGATFRGCDLTDVDLTGSKLKGADFRGSILDGIRVAAGQLQGTIIDPVQALYIVGMLGIKIKDPEQDP